MTFTQPAASRTSQVTSADGTIIGYRQMGAGPGLVILHGVFNASQHYLRLAEALSDSFTVYIPDRRGRGMSGPQGAEYSVTKEAEDLGALLRQTGSRLVFGHSFGGLVALEAALMLPIEQIEQLAVYEPGVSINGSIPVRWLPPFEQALAGKKSVRALAIFLKGAPLNWIGSLPLWLLYPIARLILNGADGRERIDLLPLLIQEFHVLRELDSQYERYHGIAAKTLLLGGGKSPKYLLEALAALQATIPHAQLIEFPPLDHNAPDLNAPNVIAQTLKEFFSAGPHSS